MRRHDRGARWWIGALLLGACGDSGGSQTSGHAPGDGGASLPMDDETSSSASEGGEPPGPPSDGGTADEESGGDGPGFDLGGGKDESAGDSDTGAPDEGDATCVDTTAMASLLLSPCEGSVEFSAAFADHYACREYVSLPGVMSYDGNTTFAYDDPDLLLISGWAGGMVQIHVTRDEHCHITGFIESEATPWVDTEPADVTVRGMAYDDAGHMFLLRSTQSTPHELGQRGPGSAITTRVDDPMALLPAWPAMTYDNPTVGLAVVPAGFPGEGRLKVVVETEDTATWFDAELAADDAGTFELVSLVDRGEIHPPDAGWGGYFGRGIAYVAAGNPAIDVDSVFITDSWDYQLAVYEIDDDGDPILGTRRVFAEGYGLGIPSGANRDAASHDVIVTGYRSNRLVAIRGFGGTPGDRPTEPRG